LITRESVPDSRETIKIDILLELSSDLVCINLLLEAKWVELVVIDRKFMNNMVLLTSSHK